MEKEQEYYDKMVAGITEGDFEKAAINIRHCIEYMATKYTEEFLPANIYDDTFEKIEALTKAGIISKQSSNIFHQLRKIGNSAAHDVDALDADEIRAAKAPLERIMMEFSNREKNANGISDTSNVINSSSLGEKQHITFDEIRLNALDYFKHQQYIQAAKGFRTVLRMRPESPDIRLLLAYCEATDGLDMASPVIAMHSKLEDFISELKKFPIDYQWNILNEVIHTDIKYLGNYYFSEKLRRTASSGVSKGLYELGFFYHKLADLINVHYKNDDAFMDLAVKTWKYAIFYYGRCSFYGDARAKIDQCSSNIRLFSKNSQDSTYDPLAQSRKRRNLLKMFTRGQMDTHTTRICAYLFWVHAYIDGDKEGAKTHLNNGLVLLITIFSSSFLCPILTYSTRSVIVYILCVVYILWLVSLWFKGLKYAKRDEDKELPIIGKIHIIK